MIAIVIFCSVISGIVGFGLASTMSVGAYNKGYEDAKTEILND